MPAEGTDNENTANRQDAAGQGLRLRAAYQNRGLRAQLQVFRRARLTARISEDEDGGILELICFTDSIGG